MERLSDTEAAERLAALPGWERDGRGIGIRRRYGFPSFEDAIRFVNRVAEHAAAIDHHPDILVEYDRVTLTLWTHAAGGLTERDFRLARHIDS